MQLATLLLKYLQGDLVHHRKELIKFGWNHLKREDSASKQWAFVNVCHFLEAYQAPEKIILQVLQRDNNLLFSALMFDFLMSLSILLFPAELSYYKFAFSLLWPFKVLLFMDARVQ